MAASSLAVFKARLDGTLNNLLRGPVGGVPVHGRGVGTS